MYTQGLGCCKGLGESIDFSSGYAMGGDPDINTSPPISSWEINGPGDTGSSINWNALLPGVFKTAEQIGIMQTTPAGRYVQTTPGGGSIVYQQPTSGGIPGLSLPGLTLPTGFSTGTLLLLGGGILVVMMMMKK